MQHSQNQFRTGTELGQSQALYWIAMRICDKLITGAPTSVSSCLPVTSTNPSLANTMLQFLLSN